MKKQFVLFLALILLALTLTPESSVQSQKTPRFNGPYVKDRILVKLRDDIDTTVDAGQVPDLMLRLPGSKTERLDFESQPGARNAGGLYLLELDGTISVEEAVARAEASPMVEFAEPDYIVRPNMTPNDTRFVDQWGLLNTGALFGKPGADINVAAAWELTTGSSDLVVGVLDTGVDILHPDLAPNRWINPNEVAGNGFDDDGNGFTDDINGWNFFSDNNNVLEDPTIGFGEGFGHGTHVAGTIGAAGNNSLGVTGVAWNVKLMGLRVIGRDTDGEVGGPISALVEGINYAIAQRARGINIRVINSSLGGAGNAKALRNAIRNAGDAGILVVASAGNSGADNDTAAEPNYPAAWSSSIDTLISVAALNRVDNLWGGSNTGHTTVDVGAPGVDILSTFPGDGYIPSSGTSMATPHVSGIAALIWSREPGLTPAEVKQRIRRTAQPIVSLASRVASSGRANALAALNNTVPDAELALARVETNKKFVTVDGLAFAKDSFVVEVNGIPLTGKVSFDNAFALGNGTFSQARVKAGKSQVKNLFPVNTTVQVTVFDPTTGKRTAAVGYRKL